MVQPPVPMVKEEQRSSEFAESNFSELKHHRCSESIQDVFELRQKAVHVPVERTRELNST